MDFEIEPDKGSEKLQKKYQKLSEKYRFFCRFASKYAVV